MDRWLSLNLKYISEYISRYNKVDVWAAWGTLIRKRRYLRNTLRDIAEALEGVRTRWVKIGNVSKDGHPHHPLYLSRKSKIETFDIDGYLRGL